MLMSEVTQKAASGSESSKAEGDDSEVSEVKVHRKDTEGQKPVFHVIAPPQQKESGGTKRVGGGT